MYVYVLTLTTYDWSGEIRNIFPIQKKQATINSSICKSIRLIGCYTIASYQSSYIIWECKINKYAAWARVRKKTLKYK